MIWHEDSSELYLVVFFFVKCIKIFIFFNSQFVFSAQSDSPSSDKSVENYEQNTPKAQHNNINGKVPTPRNKIQRHEATELYKPKLHYLSRRNVD